MPVTADSLRNRIEKLYFELQEDRSMDEYVSTRAAIEIIEYILNNAINSQVDLECIYHAVSGWVRASYDDYYFHKTPLAKQINVLLSDLSLLSGMFAFSNAIDCYRSQVGADDRLDQIQQLCLSLIESFSSDAMVNDDVFDRVKIEIRKLMEIDYSFLDHQCFREFQVSMRFF